MNSDKIAYQQLDEASQNQQTQDADPVVSDVGMTLPEEEFKTPAPPSYSLDHSREDPFGSLKKDGQSNSTTEKGGSKGTQNAPSDKAGSKFECNICLEVANEPCVTKCGHLYCWICIYQWLNQRKETLLCPVCKAGISVDSLIPIYTKGSTEDPRKKKMGDIPKRPNAERMGPVPNENFNNGLFGQGRSNGFIMGFGLFPALFTLNFSWDDIFGTSNQGNASNNEETREQQLQRLLSVFVFFMFMSFVFFGGDVFLTF